jgi:hypothetical protein
VALIRNLIDHKDIFGPSRCLHVALLVCFNICDRLWAVFP